MVLDNSTHDCKAQSSTTLLGGEIWKKQAFLGILGHASAAVSYANLDRISAGYQRRRNLDFFDH